MQTFIIIVLSYIASIFINRFTTLLLIKVNKSFLELKSGSVVIWFIPFINLVFAFIQITFMFITIIYRLDKSKSKIVKWFLGNE
jgi:hypothetical protein